VSIEQLIAYLDELDAAADTDAEPPSAASAATSTDPVAATQSLRSTKEVPLPTEHGNLRARAFTIDGHDHLGVFAGSVDPASAGPLMPEPTVTSRRSSALSDSTASGF